MEISRLILFRSWHAVETKFLWLFKPVALGDRIDGWRVCWVGRWDKWRVLFVVMVERRKPAPWSDPPGGRDRG